MKQQQRIDTLLQASSPLLSLEFFPPKSDEAIDRLTESAVALQPFQPDFVSVTYGAGGSTRERSAVVSERMQNDMGFNVMPHLTCVGATREEIGEIVDDFYEQGYRNIMALRGDPPKDQESFVVTEGGFAHASDLVAFIRDRHPDICIGVAGYPEKHPESPSLDRDLEMLKLKVDAGASFITTQLFFDNRHYFDFVDRARALGITIPIFPGIMPVIATKQIQRIVSLCGASLPAALESALQAAGDDESKVRQIGADWARGQLEDLLANGVPGVHLYALNRSDAAIDLMQAFRNA